MTPPVDFAPRKQIEDAERRLYEVAESGRYEGGFQAFAQAITTAVDMAAKAYQRDGRLSGIATGLHDLDSKMGGLQASDLIIVAGRPGMGKTALATNIAYNIAKAWQGEVRPDGHITTVNGGIVGFFSLEMSAEQLATRIIAERTGIPSSTIRRGGINEQDFEVIRDVSLELQNMKFFVDETGGLSIAQLAARARRLKRQRGLDLLVIDYIQLLSGSSKRSQDNRVQEITEITTNLKALAKELKVPIIALSQLSRQVESRDDKRPQLSDLRESGSIEQDADVVLFVYREEYYLANKEPRPGTEEHAKWRSKWNTAARQGRSHHRQAAPRPDRHRRPAIRRQRHPFRRPRAGRTGARSHSVNGQFDGQILRRIFASGAALALLIVALQIRPRQVGPHAGQEPLARACRVREWLAHLRAARGRGRRHSDHRPFRHRSQLEAIALAVVAGRMRGGGQGRRLWLRARAGFGDAAPGRLRHLLCRRSCPRASACAR